MGKTFWNPLDKYSDINLSEDNLTLSKTQNSFYSGVRANIGIKSGKWYWEITINNLSSYINGIGICTLNQSFGGFTTVSGFTNVRMYNNNATKIKTTSTESYGVAFQSGDVISILLDMDNKKIEFWKNGVSNGVAYNDIDNNIEWYPCCYGVTNSFSVTTNFGAKQFKYKAPTEYKSFDVSTKFLIKQNNQYYTIKSEFYPIGQDTLTKEMVDNYGSDSLTNFTNTFSTNSRLMTNGGVLGAGQQFSVDLNNEMLSLNSTKIE